jgi:hypothetical protein
MSNTDVRPSLVKLAYRGFGGFFVALFLFVFFAVGAALSFAGALITAFCWVPIAFPETLEYMFMVEGEAVLINDPGLASVILLLIGLLLLGLGFLFLFITYIMGRAAIVVDKSLSRIVDQAFISKSDRITQLERLASLREQGILSPEEFMQEKARILGQANTYPEDPEEWGKHQFVKKE